MNAKPLTVGAAASMLGLTIRATRELILKGYIPRVPAGRRILTHLEGVHDFIRRNPRPDPPATPAKQIEPPAAPPAEAAPPMKTAGNTIEEPTPDDGRPAFLGKPPEVPKAQEELSDLERLLRMIENFPK